NFTRAIRTLANCTWHAEWFVQVRNKSTAVKFAKNRSSQACSTWRRQSSRVSRSTRRTCRVLATRREFWFARDFGRRQLRQ
ncbi:hypothetical protein PFISCL1PPCAC_5153, partial [Pristionchus fissidentatus]